jgi:sugar/nucleoside kinase (ribokinase family)
MLTEPPPHALDLVVLGGLTIDRFPDGSSAPGGSVIHIARAAAAGGLQLGVATAAGPEPVALAGLAELRRLSQAMEVASYPVTTTFRHREAQDGRRLWLERLGGAVRLSPDAYDRITTHAVLYAPVANEIEADALAVWNDPWVRGAILQGWLRGTRETAEVTSVLLDALPGPQLEALRTFDLLVASREDLVAEAVMPWDQLTKLRRAFGRAPVLVVTDGADGLWLDHPGVRPDLDWRDHLAVPFRVDGVSTVGAGDILAAYLVNGARNPPQGWRAHAESAMRMVSEVLEERKRP